MNLGKQLRAKQFADNQIVIRAQDFITNRFLLFKSLDDSQDDDATRGPRGGEEYAPQARSQGGFEGVRPNPPFFSVGKNDFDLCATLDVQ